jgi:hypothetical protein
VVACVSALPKFVLPPLPMPLLIDDEAILEDFEGLLDNDEEEAKRGTVKLLLACPSTLFLSRDAERIEEETDMRLSDPYMLGDKLSLCLG